MTTSQPHPDVVERWAQARVRNLLARTFGQPQLARRERLRARARLLAGEVEQCLGA
ncbi:hypothetical protein ACGF5S_32600 [Nocardia nova]|uniref:hypothetical protein n=1 Tax=Nocardia nova TaxID=37330 RepID=UPI003719AB3E